MKKMYIVTVIIIFIITLTYLFFYNEEKSTAEDYIKSFGYETGKCSYETYTIPQKFDNPLYDYNLIQLSQGFDLSPYKGRTAGKYTFEIKNVSYPIYANIFLINREIIASDIVNPSSGGSVLPVIHINDLIKYHIPAKKDAKTP